MVSTKVLDSLGRFRFSQPFEPFELVFKDGRRAPITTPEGVGWHAGHDRLSYAAEDDSFVHAALSEVSDVVPLQRTTGNGATQ